MFQHTCYIRLSVVSMSAEDTCREACTEEGSIRVIGPIGPIDENFGFVGHMELCYLGWWRAVCANHWDLRDATVVCRQMLNLSSHHSGTVIYPQIYKLMLTLNGMLAPSDFVVQVCIDSCLGESSSNCGIRGFNCTGTESRLTECIRAINNTGKCDKDAGLVCCK